MAQQSSSSQKRTQIAKWADLAQLPGLQLDPGVTFV